MSTTDELKKELSELRNKGTELRRELRHLERNSPVLLDYQCDVCQAAPGVDCKKSRKVPKHMRTSNTFTADKKQLDEDILARENMIKGLDDLVKKKEEEHKQVRVKSLYEDVSREANEKSGMERELELERKDKDTFKVKCSRNFYTLRAGDVVDKEVLDAFRGSKVDVKAYW